MGKILRLFPVAGGCAIAPRLAGDDAPADRGLDGHLCTRELWDGGGDLLFGAVALYVPTKTGML